MQVERGTGLTTGSTMLLGLGTGLVGAGAVIATSGDMWMRVLAMPAGAGGAIAGGAAAVGTNALLGATGLDEDLPAPVQGAVVGAAAGTGAAAGAYGVFRGIVGGGLDSRLKPYGVALLAGGTAAGALVGALTN